MGAHESLNEERRKLHERSPRKGEPVDFVRWVPTHEVRANAYNPNIVANREMVLLKRSILADGFTQPVVVVEDGEGGYVVVDGFHRWSVASRDPEVRRRLGGMVPVVVIAGGIAARMAATVRHNRARGAHTVQGMSRLVLSMLGDGMSDEDVCRDLGMDPEELLRLKHITGYAKLFEDREHSPERLTRQQMKLIKTWEARYGKGSAPV